MSKRSTSSEYRRLLRGEISSGQYVKAVRTNVRSASKSGSRRSSAARSSRNGRSGTR